METLHAERVPRNVLLDTLCKPPNLDTATLLLRAFMAYVPSHFQRPTRPLIRKIHGITVFGIFKGASTYAKVLQHMLPPSGDLLFNLLSCLREIGGCSLSFCRVSGLGSGVWGLGTRD